MSSLRVSVLSFPLGVPFLMPRLSLQVGDGGWPRVNPSAGGERRISTSITRKADSNTFPMFVVKRVSLDEDVDAAKPGPSTSLPLTRIDLPQTPTPEPEQYRANRRTL